MTLGGDTAKCEACGAPCRAQSSPLCFGCGHRLGQPPDWSALRREESAARTKLLALAALFVAIAALYLFLPPIASDNPLWGSLADILGIVGGPLCIGLSANEWNRYRALRRMLARGASSPSTKT